VRALVALAAAMLGCSSVDDGRTDLVVYVAAAEPEQFAAARAAAAEWRACGARRVFIRATPDVGAVPLYFVDASDAELEGHAGVERYDGDFTPRRIKVDRAMTGEALHGTIAHEMGHALLRSPWHYGRGLMAEGVERPNHVTAEDCELLRARSRARRVATTPPV
jgi:hypothetical protein